LTSISFGHIGLSASPCIRAKPKLEQVKATLKKALQWNHNL